MVFSFLTYSLASFKPLHLEHESELPHCLVYFSLNTHHYYFVVGSLKMWHSELSIVV